MAWAKGKVEGASGRLTDREGFVIPATIFALLMMSTLAVAAILTSGDAQRSSRAIRESAVALYAAEAGLNEVWATWDDTLIAGLNPGDSLDLGWRNLPAGGSSYRVVIRRMDNGGQKMFALTSEGRGGGPLGGQRVIGLSLSAVNLQICCKGAATGGVEGEFEDMWLDSLGLGGVTASGFDTLPAQWAGGEICGNTVDSIPGVVWRDTTRVEIENSAAVYGNPPVVQDPSLDSVGLYDWGALNYDSLVARANITISGGTYTIQPEESPPGTCDTSVPTNWGAPEDPTHPCFEYFPIIHVPSHLELEDPVLPGGAGQGILLVDGRLEIEKNFRFYGIVIVKDEFEMADNVHVFGGVIVGDELEVEDGASIQYSQCAVNRTLSANNLTVTKVLASRSWGEVLR